MQLIPAKTEHVKEIMTWFNNESELSSWSGPNFRYPFTLETFQHDLQLNKLNSYALVSLDNKLMAFGQFYLRLDRCHLGRLAVSPNFRGQGVAGLLMSSLCEIGHRELDTTESSLFVLADNNSAITAYEKFGFKQQDYPEPMPIKNCLYMTKQN
jgi:ribosomal protein S18 acetylase RimI-like enzyme